MKTYTSKKLFDFTGSAAAEVRCQLGEGPTWNANNVGGHRRTLSWVDIKGGKLFLYDTISNRISVIFIVHLEEDQFHYALHLGKNLFGSNGASSGSGSSATASGMNEALLVEGKPTIAGEVETIGFAVPVADSDVFLCGSQHGLFYLKANHISALSVSSHDDKNATVPTTSPLPFSAATSEIIAAQIPTENPNVNTKVLMDTTALQYSAAAGQQAAATIRFYTFYVTMEQYIYTLPPALNNTLPKFEPFTALKIQTNDDDVNADPFSVANMNKNAVVGGGRNPIAASHSHKHRIRFNDAKADRSGRLFMGTMDNEEREPIGNLFVLDPEEHTHGLVGSPTPSTTTTNKAGGAGFVITSGAHDASTHGSSSNSHLHTSFLSLRKFLGSAAAGFGTPTISNGIDWSPCNTIMYYVDSVTKRVDMFDYRVFSDHSRCRHSQMSSKKKEDKDTLVRDNTAIASPSSSRASRRQPLCENTYSFNMNGRRPFFDLASQGIDGFPDGLTVDAMGNVWVAIWGGGRVICISPTTRKIIAEVKVPGVSNVTSVCFGGPALSWLIITTAMKEGEPDSGNVFVADYLGGIVGLPATEFKGTAFSPPSISAFAAPRSKTPVKVAKKKGDSESDNEHFDETQKMLFQSKL